jgi:hypothetical protein
MNDKCKYNFIGNQEVWERISTSYKWMSNIKIDDSV